MGVTFFFYSFHGLVFSLICHVILGIWFGDELIFLYHFGQCFCRCEMNWIFFSTLVNVFAGHHFGMLHYLLGFPIFFFFIIIILASCILCFGSQSQIMAAISLKCMKNLLWFFAWCLNFSSTLSIFSCHSTFSKYWEHFLILFSTWKSSKLRIFAGPNPQRFCVAKHGFFKSSRKTGEESSRIWFQTWPNCIIECLVDTFGSSSVFLFQL